MAHRLGPIERVELLLGNMRSDPGTLRHHVIFYRERSNFLTTGGIYTCVSFASVKRAKAAMSRVAEVSNGG